MKVAVTSKGENKDSVFEGRFGRTPYFLIFDTESDECKAVKNPYSQEASGVGPRAAQLLVDNSVNKVITGNVGGNAASALQMAGIEVVLDRNGGSAEEVYNKNKA
ncbi:NifB/NifX family molybdenum-iron cluster-binding protein [Methanoplanus endosymbiosus]|uniref:Dinitrogenase iron-molybdenum cofactor biosynthesis protein n=1 Tax=Methanoplanus endosymbiosus TaxID=33865 RepID=A0A9E7TJF4_9EURY|nr:NifB/NifX family molybdenum-iron cluster-binding protein [Methanoplanus endosymbiosus]UUX93583.1 dinitrogenase iron-molybdenum cofactor biosynthesis protein [Methanoplanus endosymbiosus]